MSFTVLIYIQETTICQVSSTASFGSRDLVDPNPLFLESLTFEEKELLNS